MRRATRPSARSRFNLLRPASGSGSPEMSGPAEQTQNDRTPTPEAPAETSPPSPEPADRILEAVQAALAGEHACVYGYGVIGANLSGDEQAAARRARRAHEAQRDALHDHVLALDAAPEAALPAYALPFDVDDAASARELAATLEERLAAVYVDLVAAGPEDDLRAFAAETLIDVAVEYTRWTGSTTAFPGLENR